MAEKKTIQDRIRESNLSAFSSIGSPLPGTGVRYDMDNQSTLTPAQTAYLASVFAPGAGVTDATGNFPEFPGPDVALVDAFSGDPMPSMAENIAAGGIDRYLFAPLQGLGVLGDAAYGIPFAGPVIAGGLKAPAALATLAGGIAKASKGSKAAKKGVGSLESAKKMGFRTDEPVYHGTHSEKFDAFDDSFIGNRDEGFFGKGFYFTSEPGEASYYGPNVGKYFTKGKLLDLSQNNKNSNYELLDKKYFKFWTKELDKLDMLDEPTKIGMKTINKIDDYVEKNVKFIDATDSYGNDGVAAYVKHPTNKYDEISEQVERLYSNFGAPDKKTAIESLKNNIINQTNYDSDLRKLYPGTDNILYSLSDYIRIGGKGAEELTQQAKKAGYDGIKVGDETVIFDSKNIRSVDAKFDPKKSESSNLLASMLLPVAGAGGIAALTIDDNTEDNDKGVGSIK